MRVLERYLNQTRLLLRVLSDIAAEEVFALKGGTAINLFYRDMPRLSVDIDLVYLPVRERDASLRDIGQDMDIEDPAALSDRGADSEPSFDRRRWFAARRTGSG